MAPRVFFNDAHRVGFGVGFWGKYAGVFLGVSVYASAAWAGSGFDEVFFHLPQVCQITVLDSDGPPIHCTGTLSGDRIISTADHCLRKTPKDPVAAEENIRIHCDCTGGACKFHFLVQSIVDAHHQGSVPETDVADLKIVEPSFKIPDPLGIASFADFYDDKTERFIRGAECFFGGFGLNEWGMWPEHARYFRVHSPKIYAENYLDLVIGQKRPAIRTLGGSMSFAQYRSGGLPVKNGTDTLFLAIGPYPWGVRPLDIRSREDPDQNILGVTAPGDSGGPLLCRENTKKPLRVVAITSFSFTRLSLAKRVKFYNYFFPLRSLGAMPFLTE